MTNLTLCMNEYDIFYKQVQEKILNISNEYVLLKGNFPFGKDNMTDEREILMRYEKIIENLFKLYEALAEIVIDLEKYNKIFLDELNYKKLVIENRATIAKEINEKMTNRLLDKLYNQDILINQLQKEKNNSIDFLGPDSSSKHMQLLVHVSNSPINKSIVDINNDITKTFESEISNITTSTTKQYRKIQLSKLAEDHSKHTIVKSFKENILGKTHSKSGNEKRNRYEPFQLKQFKKTKNLQQYVNIRSEHKNKVTPLIELSQSIEEKKTGGKVFKPRGKIRSQSNSLVLSTSNVDANPNDMSELTTTSKILNTSHVQRPEQVYKKPLQSKETSRIWQKYYEILENYNKRKDEVSIQRRSSSFIKGCKEKKGVCDRKIVGKNGNKNSSVPNQII